jgi:hypothetical protein
MSPRRGAISTRLGAQHQKWVPLSLAHGLPGQSKRQGPEFDRRTQGLRPGVKKRGEMALSLSKGPVRGAFTPPCPRSE